MCNLHVYGCFHGVSAVFVVQLFVYMVEWGSQAVMLTDLNTDTELGAKVNSVTGMASITPSSIQTAQALVVFSAMMFGEFFSPLLVTEFIIILIRILM
mgnify:FL=1|jgi:hypothetical protein